MADPSPYPVPGDDGGLRAGRPPATPRWVKLFGLMLLLLLLMVVLMMVTGNHGPERHLPSSSVSRPTLAMIHGGHPLRS